jgi:hypothetical protein
VRLRIESRSATATRYLRLMEFCFQYSFLAGRQPRLTASEQERLSGLCRIFQGDDVGGRRDHRRYATYLPALVTSEASQSHSILLNFSGGGLMLATTHDVPIGSMIQVLVGQPGRLEYLFNCVVVRTMHGNRWSGLGCRFITAPIEVRAR